LSATLGTELSAAVEAIEETAWRGFLENCAQSFSFFLSAKPYRGTARLALSPQLVTLFLDRLLGSGGGTGTEIRRELTAIESSILEMALHPIVSDLKEAWSGLAPLDFRLNRDAVANSSVDEAEADDPLLAISVRIGEGDSTGLLKVAVPWLAVVAARQEGVPLVSADVIENAPRKTVLEMIQNLTVKLEARLRGATVQAGQLLALKQGDVLNLGYPVDRPVQCLVNGKCKYTGKLVSSGSRISVRIDALTPNPDA
jgi:flagellar motor switch protein FliM